MCVDYLGTTRTYKNAEYLNNNNNNNLVTDMTDAIIEYKEACKSRYNHTLRFATSVKYIFGIL